MSSKELHYTQIGHLVSLYYNQQDSNLLQSNLKVHLENQMRNAVKMNVFFGENAHPKVNLIEKKFEELEYKELDLN